MDQQTTPEDVYYEKKICNIFRSYSDLSKAVHDAVPNDDPKYQLVTTSHENGLGCFEVRKKNNIAHFETYVEIHGGSKDSPGYITVNNRRPSDGYCGSLWSETVKEITKRIQSELSRV